MTTYSTINGSRVTFCRSSKDLPVIILRRVGTIIINGRASQSRIAMLRFVLEKLTSRAVSKEQPVTHDRDTSRAKSILVVSIQYPSILTIRKIH